MDAARLTVLEAADVLERGIAGGDKRWPRNQPEVSHLRDTFAAAALTGLTSRPQWMPEECVAESYKLADAMLRERERTNHDAVPEATARTDADRDRTDKAAARHGEGTGDIPCARAREIAAYAVYLHGEYDSSYGADEIDEALEIAAECSGEVVPLYRKPMLAGEELKAIRRAAAVADEMHDARMKAALGGLLERLA
jgi:hypothetical protein